MGETVAYIIAGLGSVIGAFGVIIMWLASTRLQNIEKDVKQNTQDITNTQIHYLQKGEFKDFKNELRENFERVNNRLDEIVEHVQKR